jgi:hypothetical protein
MAEKREQSVEEKLKLSDTLIIYIQNMSDHIVELHTKLQQQQAKTNEIILQEQQQRLLPYITEAASAASKHRMLTAAAKAERYMESKRKFLATGLVPPREEQVAHFSILQK